MKINELTLTSLGPALSAERKRQKLSREDAAAVCGVSTSFIRDAESHPENCTLAKLVKLVSGLGLSLEIPGLGQQALIASEPRRPTDYGVPESQLVQPAPKAGRP